MQKRAARMSKYKMIKFDDVTKKKIKQNIIKIGHIFQIICIEH